jgi:hypothetical protein
MAGDFSVKGFLSKPRRNAQNKIYHGRFTGRNLAPLDDHDRVSAVSTFIGLDREAPVRYEEGARTRFRVEMKGNEITAEIVFGPDLYPGGNIVDPNSSLSMRAAAAHELVHYYRWKDKTEIVDLTLEAIDEAMTSLSAILRFPRELSDQDIRQLVADAIHRLQHYAKVNLKKQAAANGANQGENPVAAKTPEPAEEPKKDEK